MITRSVGILSEKYAQSEEDLDVAVGLRPSGVIHLGNMFTLGLAGFLSRTLGPHLSKVQVTICDLDIPDTRDWNIKQNKYVKYFEDIPDKNSCHGNLLDHSLEGILGFNEGISNHFGVSLETHMLSEIQKKDKFRESLKKILDMPHSFMKYLVNQVQGKGVLVYPLCPECHTSNPYPSIYEEGKLKTSCSNPSCKMKNYEVDVKDTSVDLAVHYFIDPLRDRCVDPKAKIHVFGGDYNEQHGSFCSSLEDGNIKGGDKKINKILKVMEVAGERDVPDILIGPKLYSKDGTKMSKSRENGLTNGRLKEHFGKSYPSRVCDMVEYFVGESYKNLDYKLIESHLFR